MSNISIKQFFLGFFMFMILVSGCSSTPDPIPVSPMNTPDIVIAHTAQTASSTPLPTEIKPTLTPTIAPVQDSSHLLNDKALFVGENYPDYSILNPGEEFVKTFEIKNIGASSWTKLYSLKLAPSSAGIILNSPEEVVFPSATAPQEIVSISIELAAPTTPGTYTVSWNLMNEFDEIIPIGGGDTVWATIMVCDPDQPCSPPIVSSNTTINQISVSLTEFYSNDEMSNVSFCMTLPSRNYAPGPATVSLLVDQEEFIAARGGSLSIGCFEFQFPVSEDRIDQAGNVSVSIEHVRILGGVNYPDSACQSARATLIVQYPGLDFECQFSMSGYHTALQLPVGMTATQAEQLIFDAVEGAVYGPWVLTIK